MMYDSSAHPIQQLTSKCSICACVFVRQSFRVIAENETPSFQLLFLSLNKIDAAGVLASACIHDYSIAWTATTFSVSVAIWWLSVEVTSLSWPTVPSRWLCKVDVWRWWRTASSEGYAPCSSSSRSMGVFSSCRGIFNSSSQRLQTSGHSGRSAQKNACMPQVTSCLSNSLTNV